MHTTDLAKSSVVTT